MSLSLKATRKEGGVGDTCYSTAGHGGGEEDRTPRERMGVAAMKREKWAISLTSRQDENSSIW